MSGVNKLSIRVLIVDDHVLFLESLKYILLENPIIEVINTLSEPEKLMTELTENSPDLILMDIRIKNHNGLELTRIVKESFPYISVIILTGYNDDEYIEAAYNAGASGFIAKEKSNELLITTIKQVYEGYQMFPKHDTGTVNKKLTITELEVLKKIAEDKSNYVISTEMMVSKRTVENHVSSIIRKLEVDSRVGAVVKAIKNGLINVISPN